MFDKFLAVLMALLMVVLVGLMVWLVYLLIDSVGITATNTTITVVESKEVVSAHTTYILVGKVLVPQFQPESYRLHFRIDGTRVSSTVEKDFFDNVSIGDRIEVDYGFGRLSNSLQPTQIKLIG